MGCNVLALFDAIRKSGGRDNEHLIRARLVALAFEVGLSVDEIFSALHSKRGLVIYEP
jgi:hypothetical protein